MTLGQPRCTPAGPYLVRQQTIALETRATSWRPRPPASGGPPCPRWTPRGRASRRRRVLGPAWSIVDIQRRGDAGGQLALQDLADGVAGERVDEFEALRPLEGGDPQVA